MGPLSKVVGGGIGLAKEYSADRKARKSSPQPPLSVDHEPDLNGVRPEYDSDRSTDHDEDNWELDEAQRDVAPSDALVGENGRDVDEILDAFFKKHHEPPQYTETGQLPCPVILPQRRPQMNTRGFVRAYAPVLQSCDIDQSTWMDFLNGFHKAIKVRNS